VNHVSRRTAKQLYFPVSGCVGLQGSLKKAVIILAITSSTANQLSYFFTYTL